MVTMKYAESRKWLGLIRVILTMLGPTSEVNVEKKEGKPVPVQTLTQIRMLKVKK